MSEGWLQTRFWRIALPLLVGVAVLLVWQGAVTAFDVPSFVLPAPTLIAESLVANFGSLMGSLGDNGSGGHTSYRVSKAAVNMVVRNMGYEFESDGLICFALHPGWVQTDMGGPSAPLGREDSIKAMLATIRAKDATANGGFFDREGATLPW